MGGSALKCLTRRLSRVAYLDISLQVQKIVISLFPDVLACVVPSYGDKYSFGDLDIIIDSSNLPNDWQEQLCKAFVSKAWHKNGNVFSVEYKEFQIDFIVHKEEDYYGALSYYAFNDLGNLLGRIAHSMDLKLGPDGLSYKWMHKDCLFKIIVVEKEWHKILSILGLDPDVYDAGFQTTEDIFKYVASSHFFSSDIYLLHNRSGAGRARDSKRKTYMEFLHWLTNNKTRNYPKFDKDVWLYYLKLNIPDFKDSYDEVEQEFQQIQRMKTRFNGSLVSEWTGLKGKELGMFMRWVSSSHEKIWLQNFVLTSEPEVVKQWCINSLKWVKMLQGIPADQ